MTALNYNNKTITLISFPINREVQFHWDIEYLISTMKNSEGRIQSKHILWQETTRTWKFYQLKVRA